MYQYEEFKVRIERAQTGAFRVIASGPAGDGSAEFRVPFSELEIENFLLKVGRARKGVRRLESPEMGLAKQFGTGLFEALFHGTVRDVYRASLEETRKSEKGLRVTLYLTSVPELMHLPWEYLYDAPDFLSISVWTPVVRYLDLPRPRQPLTVHPPLRILGMVSNPPDVVSLDVEVEKKKLEQALSKLVKSGLVEIEWLERATLRELQRRLRQQTFHIFHYIGHGAYDAERKDGLVLLEGDDGQRSRAVTGVYLGTLLGDHTSLRLVVLNSCEGARTSTEDPFAGVASSLVQQDIPAVVAMQFEITDRAAIIFAEEFYASLADGYPVDAALAEARKAIFSDMNDIEWGTPVLFMRIVDGRIFDITRETQMLASDSPLTLYLQPVPPNVSGGDEVVWSLTIKNQGETVMKRIIAIRKNGVEIAEPFDLGPGVERTISWTDRPRGDLPEVVSVVASDSMGRTVEQHVQARASIRKSSIDVSVVDVAPGKPQKPLPGIESRLIRYFALLGLLLLLVAISIGVTFPTYVYIEQTLVYNIVTGGTQIAGGMGATLLWTSLLAFLIGRLPLRRLAKENRTPYALISGGITSLAYSVWNIAILGGSFFGPVNLNPAYAFLGLALFDTILVGLGGLNLVRADNRNAS